MENNIDHELFKNQLQEFAVHLKPESNYRIIFSGRFGIGKTTFLKHFFSEIPQNQEEFRVIHLFPVNYSVAENADIFEYIKYDIVSHLLSKASEGEITLDKSLIPRNLAYPILLSHKPVEILAPLLHFFGPVGKVFEGYKKLLDELEKEYKRKTENEDGALIEYLKSAQNQMGSPYEQDFFSQLIIELLDQWKSGSSIKAEDAEEKEEESLETVLIVDDLDRVDPQHIFRLLNVFAAHFDAESDDSHNKFGFDKVIFVCDEGNIRSIFRHHYGIRADYNGYLDKFYSKEIYPFRIREDIIQRLQGWVNDFYENRVNHLPIASSDTSVMSINYFTSFILETMIASDAINMRSIAKLWFTSEFTVKDREVRVGKNDRMTYRHSIVLTALEIIKWLVGNIDDFIIAIDKCIDHKNRSAFNKGNEIDHVLLVHLPYSKNSQYSNELRMYTYQDKEYAFSASYSYIDRTSIFKNNKEEYRISLTYAEDIEYSENTDFHTSIFDFLLLKDLVQRLYY